MTEKHSETTEKFIDPICGMTVSPETARGELEFQGQKYYFCSKGCLETFKKQNAIADSPNSQINNHDSQVETHEDNSGSEIDPICGMTVNPLSAAGSFNHEGKTYYFCSTGCLQKFIAQSQGVPASGFVGIGRAKKETVQHGDMKATPRGEFVDPVCRMSVSPETAAGKYEYGGETYYFCSTGCLNKFKQNPQKFLEKKKEEKQAATTSEGRSVEIDFDGGDFEIGKSYLLFLKQQEEGPYFYQVNDQGRYNVVGEELKAVGGDETDSVKDFFKNKNVREAIRAVKENKENKEK